MRADDRTPPDAAPAGGSALEVFRVFLMLGLTAFGGPVAHLGFFRDALVVRRRWIDEAGYAELVALCQFLPGPASSQVGFALGLMRGNGLRGGLAAWAGFTLPSAALLVAAALGAAAFTGPTADGLLHGLKLTAVAVVAQAVWGMARSLAPDRRRAGIALIAVMVVTFLGGAAGQIAAMALGAVAGLGLAAFSSQAETGSREENATRHSRRADADTRPGRLRVPVSRRAGTVALVLFAALLVVSPLLAAATGFQAVALFDAFYRSGALVFGGGHVVLPLLRAEVVAPGWIGNATFLAGYGLAQAVPGPLFTVAAYLGTVMGPAPNGLAGAGVALVAVFLPGLLLVYGTLPFWNALRQRPAAQAAMRGANAAVVGILAAALYDPVWTGAVLSPPDFALALAGFLLLAVWTAPSWVVVLLLAAAGTGLGAA